MSEPARRRRARARGARSSFSLGASGAPRVSFSLAATGARVSFGGGDADALGAAVRAAMAALRDADEKRAKQEREALHGLDDESAESAVRLRSDELCDGRARARARAFLFSVGASAVRRRAALAHSSFLDTTGHLQ